MNIHSVSCNNLLYKTTSAVTLPFVPSNVNRSFDFEDNVRSYRVHIICVVAEGSRDITGSHALSLKEM